MIQTQLASIIMQLNLVWYNDGVRWWLYDPNNPQTSDLTLLIKGRTYDIAVNYPCTISYQGWTQTLVAGWNTIVWMGTPPERIDFTVAVVNFPTGYRGTHTDWRCTYVADGEYHETPVTLLIGNIYPFRDVLPRGTLTFFSKPSLGLLGLLWDEYPAITRTFVDGQTYTYDFVNQTLVVGLVPLPTPTGDVEIASAMFTIQFEAGVVYPLEDTVIAEAEFTVPYTPIAPSPGEVWPCPYSDASFATREKLEAHLAIVHPEWTPEEEGISLGWLALGAAIVGGIAVAAKKLKGKA